MVNMCIIVEYALQMIRASAQNIHRNSLMIFYIAQIIQSQRDNCLPINS